MVAVYGNLMIMGVAVALFVATLNLGKRQARLEQRKHEPGTTALTDTQH
jgi:hypothetical protein